MVGWAMATHLRTELVLDALNMALWQRRPEAVMHHSDLGSTRPSPSGAGVRRQGSDRPWARWFKSQRKGTSPLFLHTL